MEQLLETSINIFTPVLLALLSLGASYLIMYLNKAKARVQAETEKIQDEKQKALVNGAIDQLDKLLEQNILNAEATLVKEIKKASEDNKLTIEEGKEVANAVTQSVLNQLTNDSKNLLNTQSQCLEEYVRAEVEVILAKIKAQSENIRK